MIIKLQDDNGTIVNVDRVSFLRLGYNYHEDERNGNCRPISHFYFIMGVGIDKLDCYYSMPLNEAGEPDVTKNPEIWQKLITDYQAIEEYLLTGGECLLMNS